MSPSCVQWHPDGRRLPILQVALLAHQASHFINPDLETQTNAA